MPNPVQIFYGTNLLFQFNPAPKSIVHSLQKTGNSPMDIPTYIRPWMFDFQSQARTLQLEIDLINMGPYSAGTPGTGSILDQYEDLLYLMSGNWFGRAGISDGFLRMFVGFPSAMDSTHNSALATLYPSAANSTSPTPNTDYLLDAGSVPNTGSSPYGGLNRPATDQVYYVWPNGLILNKQAASVVKIPATLQFLEVQDAIVI